MPRLFPECPIFRDGIGRLNQQPVENVVNAFAALCLGKETRWQQGGEERGSAKELPGGGSIDTLRIILDNVAFHPVRPEDMKAELGEVGLTGALSVRLAETWAKHARTVVNARKKVNSNLTGVEYELLTDVRTEEERVRLCLGLSNGQQSNLSLSFTPDQLCSLFEKLESVQKKLDQICS